MGIMAVLMTIGIVGCTDPQIQMIAHNAGLGAAITWISYDNPNTNVTTLVKLTLDIVSEKADSVVTGMTYTASLYPVVEEYVNDQLVDQAYKPIVLAGTLAMLNGIDLLFSIHPEWKTRQDLALKVATSFCQGAKQGLTLSGRDPIIMQAREFSVNRARVLKQ